MNIPLLKHYAKYLVSEAHRGGDDYWDHPRKSRPARSHRRKRARMQRVSRRRNRR